MNEQYQKVAYIGLRNAKGGYTLNVPLYIKLDDLNKKDVEQSNEELIHKVSQIMMQRYEKQFAEIMSGNKPPTTKTD